MLFIVSTTSRPLNKKSVCCQSADPTITAADLRPQSAVRTLLSAPAVGGKACAINSTGLGRRSHRVIVDNEPTRSLSRIYTVMAFLARVSSFFVVHFVAKRYIL